MKRRGKNESENDYKKIRTIVSTTKVTSIKEIAKIAGLSESEVNTSLIRHPQVKEEILAQLKNNREKAKKGKKETEKYFVLDASLCGIAELDEIMADFEKEKSKVILTNITIRELDKLQKFNDIAAADARYILSDAAQNQDMFFMVWIDESQETPDDCIIKYCADNKDKVVLLTADKIMTLKARAVGVNTKYYIKGVDSSSRRKASTLFPTRKVGANLILDAVSSENRSFLVISQGIEYKECICNLKIGDDVYIASKKQVYITFAHYKIISLNSTDNCQLVFSKKIYGTKDIKRLPKASYKSFMREFNHRQYMSQILVT